MAPPKKTNSNLNSKKSYIKLLQSWWKRYLTWDEVINLSTNPNRLPFVATVYLILEIIVNILVIQKVPYTEIDWKAYMQEVEGFLNGTLDYSELRGDTGPLVYPAGFVYIYSILYYLTSHGTNIRLAQYIFVALHILLLSLVFRIYVKTKKVPPYALILICCTSYRIHSIFILRLFNDPVAMVFLYASLNAFIDDRWYLGSILFSLAVSIKMNVLLYAPALLIAYLTNLRFPDVIKQLFVCAIVQFVLAFPFIITNPMAYVKGAFNLGRVFEFKWTVNWRFLPEHIFVSPYFHIVLLALHVLLLLHFARSWSIFMNSWLELKYVASNLKNKLKRSNDVDMSTMSQLFILPMFATNFIGMVFSRSLHYQFYVWYYHTLPYLAWCTNFKTVTKFVILGFIELCWNTYPSTIFSSSCLHVCHALLMFGLYKHIKNTIDNISKQAENKDKCK